jgi:carbon storage regulator CsrA
MARRRRSYFKEEEMLVLTRKDNERIVIGDDVEVVVLSVQGQRVKLGILAPRDKQIRRSETFAAPVLARNVLCHVG